MSLALIDIRSGNLGSVANALRAAGANDVVVTALPDDVLRADRIVLPGVGAFGGCIASLRAIDGLEEALETAVFRRGRPFLGICVGMQLMAEFGEEHGTHRGLGWVAGAVRRIAPVDGVRVPHMGWNEVMLAGDDHPLVRPGEAYFLHSYAFEDGAVPSSVVARTHHGDYLTAAIQTGTAVGVQFHPEKSQRYGLALLERFLAWHP